MNAHRPVHHTLREIFVWPIAVALLSAVGLLAALVGDGPWDGLSWATLLLPIVLCAVFLWRGRRRETDE